MRRRDAETIRDLVAMLREERNLLMQVSSAGLESRAEADRLQAELDGTEARIADLEARPAAPSVEQVAELLLRFLDGHVSPDEALLEIFPSLDRDPDILLCEARYRMEREAS